MGLFFLFVTWVGGCDHRPVRYERSRRSGHQEEYTLESVFNVRNPHGLPCRRTLVFCGTVVPSTTLGWDGDHRTTRYGRSQDRITRMKRHLTRSSTSEDKGTLRRSTVSPVGMGEDGDHLSTRCRRPRRSSRHDEERRTLMVLHVVRERGLCGSTIPPVEVVRNGKHWSVGSNIGSPGRRWI